MQSDPPTLSAPPLALRSIKIVCLPEVENISGDESTARTARKEFAFSRYFYACVQWASVQKCPTNNECWRGLVKTDGKINDKKHLFSNRGQVTSYESSIDRLTTSTPTRRLNKPAPITTRTGSSLWAESECFDCVVQCPDDHDSPARTACALTFCPLPSAGGLAVTQPGRLAEGR